MFAESCEQRTVNPRVGNSVITAVNMHPEGSDMIGSFLCLRVLGLRFYSCLLFDLTLSAMVEKYVNTFDFFWVKYWLISMNTSPATIL